MKQSHKWLTIGILGVTFASGSVTVNASTSPISNTKNPKNQLAQVSSYDTCVQVAPEDGLYVRKEPTVYGEALAILLQGENVTIASDIKNGWVEISSPIQGYVYADFLTFCDTAQANVTFKNCRQVTELIGVNVYENTSITSFMVGQIAYGDTVIVEDVNIDDWLLLVEPMTGYVPEDNLSYCK